MKVNDIIHGFKLISEEEIAEISSTGFEFIHEKSGAKLFYLQNKDDNKVFAISFRTPPADDTGVAHIVEHSVLCGSRKYPLKEPFVELAKGSLNTFLNAMTYPDKTMYPVASRNDKDFQNLMDVYLDAVFYPRMIDMPEILKQEGWHYEIAAEQDPLTYSGVVYNEMKGALSSPDDILSSRIMAALYPDTTYGYESGGDPEAIPQLTQEMFVRFHKQYYHPSNSYIFFYGDLDIDSKLKYLDEEYLSHFDRLEVASEVKRQPAFAGLNRMIEYYPVGSDESTDARTFLSLNMIVGDVGDDEEMLALEILNHALLKTPAAPLKQALIDAGLGKDVDTDFEVDMLQPFFSIVVNNSEVSRAEEFYETVMNTLEGLAAKGLPRDLLEASLNLLEFRLREADFGTSPKGLIYAIRVMRGWLYGFSPSLYLYYEKALARMRKGLDDGYFIKLMRRVLIDNPHKVLLMLAPSTTMAAEREENTAQHLAAVKARMTPEELKKIIAETKHLKEMQEQPDSPEALASIPILELSDIRKEANVLPLEERDFDGTKVLFSELDTNGIVYLSLFFDASAVPQDKIPYVYLLTDLLGMVDTETDSYSDLANKMNLLTGGVSIDLTPYARQGEPDSLLPKFIVRVKTLSRKLPETLALLKEILTTSTFTNEKRLRELLEQNESSFELSMQHTAHQLVAAAIFSYLAPSGYYANEGFLPFYRFMSNFLLHFDGQLTEMQEVFKDVLPRLLNKNALTVHVTSSASDYELLTNNLSTLTSGLSVEKFSPIKYSWVLSKRNEGLLSSSRVQYVGKGANFIKLGYQYTGALKVLETIMRYDYFWTAIRVMGGAYGAFTQFNSNGGMFFGSYRDPHLKTTLEVFDKTAKYLQEFKASRREMDKYIIGTISHIDTPLTPQLKGRVAADLYFTDVSFDMRQKIRDEILATQPEDIRNLASLVEACMKENALCVFGGEAKLRENAQLFGNLVPVIFNEG